MCQQQLFFLQQQQARQEQQQQEGMMCQYQLFHMQQQQNQSLFAPSQPVTARPTGFGSNDPFAPSTAPSGFNPSPRPTQQEGPTSQKRTRRTLPHACPPCLPPLRPRKIKSRTGRSRLRRRKGWARTRHIYLAALFANRDDGHDTFGNMGALRYGYTDPGRQIVAQRTT